MSYMLEMKLNGSHDIAIDGDHIARFSPSNEADVTKRVAQAALCMLKTEEGEAFTDGGHGCPWFGKILGLPLVHLDVAKNIIKKKLAAIDGVKKVSRVVIESDGRNISGSFALVCSDGGTVTGDF